jgi:hypothetical protein
MWWESWIVDHLESLHALFNAESIESLETFSITRKVPAIALVPGQHNLAPIDEPVRPKRISDSLARTICEKGRNLRLLELDYFELSVEVSKNESLGIERRLY